MRLLPIILIVWFTMSCRAQFADKQFFLVDSLDKSKLENYDLGVLDSMLTLYHKEKVDTTKLSHLLYMVENLEDPHAWIPYNRILYNSAQSALKNKNLDAQHLRFYKNILAGSYNNLGFYYNQSGKKDIALNYFKQSMTLLEEVNNRQGLSDIYNNIGLIYKNVGNISLCLEYYFKCLKICEELGDSKGKASSLNNIGMMYMDLHDYVKALEYLRDALKEWEKIGAKRGMSSSLGNLGLLYSKMGRPNMSLEYYFKALILNEKTGDKEGIGTALGNIGWVYLNKNAIRKRSTILSGVLLIKGWEMIRQELPTVLSVSEACIRNWKKMISLCSMVPMPWSSGRSWVTPTSLNVLHSFYMLCIRRNKCRYKRWICTNCISACATVFLANKQKRTD